MEELIAAAQEEGELNVIALPPDWANYGEMLDTFSEKYDIPVAITAPSQSAQFVRVVENVAIPYVGGETITIWVGFDTRG
jgi:hypothetical protein